MASPEPKVEVVKTLTLNLTEIGYVSHALELMQKSVMRSVNSAPNEAIANNYEQIAVMLGVLRNRVLSL